MRRLWSITLCAALAVAGGCDNDQDQTNHQSGAAPIPVPRPAPAPDLGVDLGAADLAGADLAPVDLAGATARVRFAHLSPDAPALDLCVAPHGTTSFQGPLFASQGLPGGIAYGQVTRELALTPGSYDARIVAGGAAGCTVALAPDTVLPALGADATVTLGAIGAATNAVLNLPRLALAVWADDTTADPLNVKLRFIHAAPGVPPVDVGVGAGATFVPVFVDVAFGMVGVAVAPPSDANGYIVLPPFSPAPVLTARLHGTTTDAITVVPRRLGAGSLATLFAIGNAGNAPRPLQLLLCLDNGPAQTALTSCAALP